MAIYIDGVLAGGPTAGGPTASDSIKHERKTITFDSSDGNGAVGIVTAFTITGRVLVRRLSVFCPLELASPGSATTISLGVASDVDEFVNPAQAIAIDTNQWWIAGAVAPGAIQLGANMLDVAVSEDIIYSILAAAVDGGTLVCDVWYEPVTDDGALAAA